MLCEIFGEKCYLEITAQDETLLPITKKVNQFIYNLAKQTNTKLIVNNDYRYLKEKDKEHGKLHYRLKIELKCMMRIVENRLENIILWTEKRLEKYVSRIDIRLKKWMNGWRIIELLQKN